MPTPVGLSAFWCYAAAMHFFAKLRINSAIFTDWRTHSRVGGLIDHVQFTWDGVTYVSQEIGQVSVDRFRARPDQAIIIEAIATLKATEPAEVVVDDPVVETKSRRRRIPTE